ncbi:Macrolide export ATP-binding/permease protein MacB [bioreactor metagenome]|jgi:putative ABC transport system permease protein|uniref:Macrolide export ATP-binding/permease protein MacB n=2 Tax=root TaxID=1 RepID=A0A644YCE5_9ZZZZ|nr:ABC transporter permease [Sedimentibacter saalensis]MEA5093953.1 FtsX-like permease family protein [Sedimentibacter saalensis]
MWLENIKIAFRSILSNKMRSLLTMLGIIIGISSVIAIVSIGDSMKGVMDDIYKGIGKNRAVLYVGNVDDFRSTDFFYLDDIELLKERFGDKIEYLGINENLRSDVTIKKNTVKLRMACVDYGYDSVQEVKMLYGRMINKNDVDRKSRVIVLEQNAAVKMFGKENATGMTVRVKIDNSMEDLLVVGVYKEEKSPVLSLLQGQDEYEDSFVPYTMAFSSAYGFYSLDVFVAEKYSVEQSGDEILNFIANLKNRNPENYIFYTVEEDQAQVDSIVGGMSIAVACIAAISLLVGGIGIMNIMLVSVTERTREIGIKKALGARTKDVLFQFLIESATLSAIGGIAGTAFGIGLVMIGGSFISIPIVVNPVSVVAAVVFAMVIGIFFGYYPARKAAKADPIEALRYE